MNVGTPPSPFFMESPIRAQAPSRLFATPSAPPMYIEETPNFSPSPPPYEFPSNLFPDSAEAEHVTRRQRTVEKLLNAVSEDRRRGSVATVTQPFGGTRMSFANCGGTPNNFIQL